MVSVVIPTYKREDAVLRALKGVLKQTYTDIEIIVVDDNGKGNEHQIATEKAVLSLDNPCIRYVVHPENRGGCAARNTGIKEARGDFIAFLDDDDVWSDEFIELMLPYFEKKEIGAVYCNYYSYNGILSVAYKKDTNHSGDVYRNILSGWCPASTSLFIVKRNSIIQAGLFDEELKSFQDYDMWLRLSKVCEFAYCKERLVLKYEGFDEQTSRNPERRKAGYKHVVEKYENSLSTEDKIYFKKFTDIYYYDTLYRETIYNHSHKISYKRQMRELLKRKGALNQKIHLLSYLCFPRSFYALIYKTLKRFDKDCIVYKGQYPV